MKKRVYRVRTRYIFEGVFEVSAESREEARQKVRQDCGLIMGGSIHSTLPDEEVSSLAVNYYDKWLYGFHSAFLLL